jgi:hypothetical protein
MRLGVTRRAATQRAVSRLAKPMLQRSGAGHGKGPMNPIFADPGASVFDAMSRRTRRRAARLDGALASAGAVACAARAS